MDERSYNQSLARKERLLFTPSRSGEIPLFLAYPNRYFLAMSNLGFQTVYRIFAEHPRLKVERAFLPENTDAECKSFETNRAISEAEILAVSVSFETDYPNVLKLLEAAGLDLDSCSEVRPQPKEKSRYRPLIVGGGAALTLNPEPLANFFDLIVIGEGEEVIPEIVECYLDCRDKGIDYTNLLHRMAKLEGVYVPSLYTVQYNEDHTIKSFQGPARVKRRIVKDIDRYPTRTNIQTSETEFSSMFMAETGRGCEVGCKFCVAGYMYRPIRKRSAEVLQETIKIGLESSDSVGFVGAAVSSHPKIAELASTVAQQGKRAALSSIMSQRVTTKLAESLSESEYKTVALAPEAGSEELRFRIGKRVCNSQILDGVRTLARSGIKHFKLYFIVGLPSETEGDVEMIWRLAAEAQQVALSAAREQPDFKTAPTLYLSVNPFIPKAWTPFQRHSFPPFKEVKRRIEMVKRGIAKIPNVEMKFESPRESYFQALLSRGDRRVGDLLLELHKSKGDWRSVVSSGASTVVAGVPEADFFVYRQLTQGEVFPWEIVDLGLKRELLDRLYRETFELDVKPVIERAKRELNQHRPMLETVDYGSSQSLSSESID